jgi:hypothetical protein
MNTTKTKTNPVAAKVEKAVVQCMDPIWDLGLFGVKVIIDDRNVVVTSYALREESLDAQIEDALKPLAKQLGRGFTVESNHCKGVIPAERISVRLAN